MLTVIGEVQNSSLQAKTSGPGTRYKRNCLKSSMLQLVTGVSLVTAIDNMGSHCCCSFITL